MSYKMFFEAVKTLLWKSLNDIPEYKLVEYMKSQEDVIKSQYNYWAEQVEINNETVTEESLPGFASGAAYSLYLLYEGQFCFYSRRCRYMYFFGRKKWYYNIWWFLFALCFCKILLLYMFYRWCKDEGVVR